ncbi:hypothetical protein [Shewanella phage vB_SbaS_Y11]|nr:hypothetical protein [Shewanella phage vB_SbaS_Y11]
MLINAFLLCAGMTAQTLQGIAEEAARAIAGNKHNKHARQLAQTKARALFALFHASTRARQHQ